VGQPYLTGFYIGTTIFRITPITFTFTTYGTDMQNNVAFDLASGIVNPNYFITGFSIGGYLGDSFGTTCGYTVTFANNYSTIKLFGANNFIASGQTYTCYIQGEVYYTNV
jgi:hypothetical protein